MAVGSVVGVASRVAVGNGVKVAVGMACWVMRAISVSAISSVAWAWKVASTWVAMYSAALMGVVVGPQALSNSRANSRLPQKVVGKSDLL